MSFGTQSTDLGNDSEMELVSWIENQLTDNQFQTGAEG